MAYNYNRIYHAHNKQVLALDRVQEMTKFVANICEKFRCSDVHENLHVSQFLCVESIFEVCFPKNEFQVNFQESEFLEDFWKF